MTMTKLQTLQKELARLNVEIQTDTGFTYRNKLRRISVITDTIVREAGNVGGGTQIVFGSSFHSDAGIPNNSIGVDGDTYLDVLTGNVYKKVNGFW